MELANATGALHDESIRTATRFVYYHFRSKKAKQIALSLFSQLIISVVRRQYRINSASVDLAASQLVTALAELSIRWQKSPYLVGDRLRVEDIAAALLTPLALVTQYHQEYPCLFETIVQHQLCGELLPRRTIANGIGAEGE